MKLIVKRKTNESKDKGFLGMGKEKVDRIFILDVQLKDVNEDDCRLMELYTYKSQGGQRRRYTELPIISNTECSIYINGKYSEIPSIYFHDLIKGVTFQSGYFNTEFLNIPNKIGTIPFSSDN